MTERLTMLFHEEAATIDVPRPPADAVLARGHDLRRRRRTTMAVVGAVAAIVLVGTTLTVAATVRGDSQVEPADLPDDAAYQQLGAWARGDEVHVGNHVVVIPGALDLQYSSAGVVVGAPQFSPKPDPRISLVTPDGEVRALDLGVTDPSRSVAADPATPYLAFVRSVDDTTKELVVLDLESDEEMYVHSFTDREPGSAKIVGLSGDLVSYFAPDPGQPGSGTMVTTNWRTGAEVPLADGVLGLGAAGDSRYIVSDDGAWQVRSRDDGEVLLKVPYVGDGIYDQSSLSPDEKWLSVSAPDQDMVVYNVETGDHVDLGRDRDVVDYGWTPDGHLVGKPFPSQPSEVEVCDPATGECVGLGHTVGPKLSLVTGTWGIATGR
ncbi:WD40 repeat domain-containing protein [Nocardioides caricicola]|uniref:WD40 repeat domain-containing protein n=1 Tax=Nocardioides caricicola TaxID=634770 RepID=A0ABW0N0W7_9ACTN